MRSPISAFKQTGFSYISLLLMVAISGIGLAMIGQVWRTQAQREKEKELLFIGEQFSMALASYAKASVGSSLYPKQLKELLDDRRLPITRRHLRKMYLDPMTKRSDWGLVIERGHIVGIHSQSEQKPLKKKFSPKFAGFEEASTYQEWIFTAP